MPTVLITGANRGIGRRLAQVFAESGHDVIATARDTAKLAGLSAEPLPLDVTDLASIRAMADALGDRPIDILINNAGVMLGRGVRFGSVTHEQWAPTFAANVMGPVAVAEALMPNLEAGGQRKIVTISSGMGSMARNTSGGEMIYRASKAAINSAMRSIAWELDDRGFTVFLMHPGWVRTDMGTDAASLSVDESAAGLAQVIERADRGYNGRFFNHDGSEIPW